MSISPNVIIMTREEFRAELDASFHKGVRRGRFEERSDQSDQSQAKATEGKAGMAVSDQGHVRRSTAGTGLQVGEAVAVQPATSEIMGVTAGETAPFPSDPPSQEASAPRHVSLDREAVKRAICKSRTCEGIRCCQWPCNGGRWHDSRQQPGPCRVEEGRYDDAADQVIALIEGAK